MKGKFIVFEGVDGTGKSTLSKYAAEYLNSSMGLKTILTREIGGTPLGEQIREILLSESSADFDDKTTSLMLISAARADHIHRVIAPALENGINVVCDRYYFSTCVYQSQGNLNTMFELIQFHQTLKFLIQPDLLVFCDANSETIAQRLHERGGDADRYEKLNTDHKRNAYHTLLIDYPNDCFTINTSHTLDNSKGYVETVCRELFKLKPRF